jgi:integrase
MAATEHRVCAEVTLPVKFARKNRLTGLPEAVALPAQGSRRASHERMGDRMSRTPRTRRKTQAAGDWGTDRVRVVKHHRNGALCLDWTEVGMDGERHRRRRVLRDATLLEAKAEAERLSVTLRESTGHATPPALTIATLFDKYVTEVTPRKGVSGRSLDRASQQLFVRLWGKRAVSSLDVRDFEAYITARRNGALRTPRGSVTGVRDCQIGHELKTLWAACHWAMKVRYPNGAFWLDRNPLKGFALPREMNPSRPMLTDAEYHALRPVAWAIAPEFGAALELVHETGHRLASVRRLAWEDLNLEARVIVWRSTKNKGRQEHLTPLTDAAVAAVERLKRERPTIGTPLLFFALETPELLRSRESFNKWWTLGETKANLARVRQRGGHSLRRKFATALLHIPMKTLQELGGWKNSRVILECYQQPDVSTQRDALATRADRNKAG